MSEHRSAAEERSGQTTESEHGEPGDLAARPRTSTRDHEELRRQLTRWLARHVAEPEVSELVVPTTNGMSSETLLFEARWRDGRQACAARLAPDPAAMPVFPVYDLERQFRVMRLVAERTNVPVPRTLWFEPDDAPLGSPFFVMERVEGQVPPDLMPYTFGSWLSEASAAERDRLQRASIAIVAELHDMDVEPADLAFLELERAGETALRRHFADQVAYYEWVVADGLRSPLLERAFTWLEDHWPVDEGPSRLSWGDSRIGNILYRDFEPVAVLDWEMAATGPREIDVGWMIWMHRFFQDIAEGVGLPGLPTFLRRDDVAATYEGLTGHAPRHLDFYTLYGALRHGIVMARIGRRAAHFGEAVLPADPDDLIPHRAAIAEMVEGVYWKRVL